MLSDRLEALASHFSAWAARPEPLPLDQRVSAEIAAEETAAQEAEEPIPPYDSEEERAMQRAAILEAEIAAEEAAAQEAEARHAQ